MHLTRGPCLLCQQEGLVVCVQCGLGLQICRPCARQLLAQFPTQTLYCVRLADLEGPLGPPDPFPLPQ